MKAPIKDIYWFSKWLIAEADAGRIDQDTADRLVACGQKALDVGPARQHSLELPSEFARYWNQFRNSEQYHPDGDSILFAMEQTNKPAPYIPPSESKSPMKTDFLQQFDQLTGETKDTFERIETARRRGSDSEIELAAIRGGQALARDYHGAGLSPVAKLFREYPEKEERWQAIALKFSGGPLTNGQRELAQKAFEPVQKAVTPGISPSDDLGAGMFLAAAASADVLNVSHQFGAYKDLGLRTLTGARMKYPMIEQPARGVFLTASTQGRTELQSNALISGDAVCVLANTIVCFVELSLELIADGQVPLQEATLTCLGQGHAMALDYACFRGDGADDGINGMQTGIFCDTNIVSASAANAVTSVGALTRDDFISAIAAVDSSALTRDPRWYLSPALLPKLLKLHDGVGPQYLLKTPVETGGPWTCLGFPITWSIEVPGNDLPGAKIAAFGAPDGYLVALQEKMELKASDAANFTRAIRQIRLLNRGFVQTRYSKWFSTLALAAQ